MPSRDHPIPMKAGDTRQRSMNLSQAAYVMPVIEGVEYWIPISDQLGLQARELIYELDSSEGRLQLKIVCHRTQNREGKRKVVVTLRRVRLTSRVAA